MKLWNRRLLRIFLPPTRSITSNGNNKGNHFALKCEIHILHCTRPWLSLLRLLQLPNDHFIVDSEVYQMQKIVCDISRDGKRKRLWNVKGWSNSLELELTQNSQNLFCNNALASLWLSMVIWDYVDQIGRLFEKRALQVIRRQV